MKSEVKLERFIMYNSTKIAENIKILAKAKDIQLKNMLQELSLNKNTLSNMYNGSMLKGDSLAKIADYLDCSVDYLLGRVQEPNITYTNINSSNIIHQSDMTDEMGIELLKAFQKLKFTEKLYFLKGISKNHLYIRAKK